MAKSSKVWRRSSSRSSARSRAIARKLHYYGHALHSSGRSDWREIQGLINKAGHMAVVMSKHDWNRLLHAAHHTLNVHARAWHGLHGVNHLVAARFTPRSGREMHYHVHSYSRSPMARPSTSRAVYTKTARNGVVHVVHVHHHYHTGVAPVSSTASFNGRYPPSTVPAAQWGSANPNGVWDDHNGSTLTAYEQEQSAF